MPDGGNAEFLEIFGGEMAQHVNADGVLAECRLVALQTQTSQPACDIHRRFLWVGDAQREYRLGVPAVSSRTRSLVRTPALPGSRPVPGPGYNATARA
jgi:hypothetical protein